MSMLSLQIKELREAAEKFEGYQNGEISRMMREAADTIEGLRDSLQEVGDQACHATQPNYEHCKYSTNRGWRDTSRYTELFGTPERAAHTSWYMLMCNYMDCDECPISDGCDIATDIYGDNGEIALLEWLRGDAE